MQNCPSAIKNPSANAYYNVVRVEPGGSIWFRDFSVTFDLVTVDMIAYEITIAVVTHSNGDMYTTRDWNSNQPNGFDQAKRCDWVNITTGQDATVINSIPISPIDQPMGVDNISRITKDAYEYFEDIVLNRAWLQETIRDIMNGRTDPDIITNLVSGVLVSHMKEITIMELRYMPDFMEESMWHMIKSIDWQYVSNALVTLIEMLPEREERNADS